MIHFAEWCANITLHSDAICSSTRIAYVTHFQTLIVLTIPKINITYVILHYVYWQQYSSTVKQNDPIKKIDINCPWEEATVCRLNNHIELNIDWFIEIKNQRSSSDLTFPFAIFLYLTYSILQGHIFKYVSKLSKPCKLIRVDFAIIYRKCITEEVVGATGHNTLSGVPAILPIEKYGRELRTSVFQKIQPFIPWLEYTDGMQFPCRFN